jgi:Flp pilus assembly protein TadB
VFMTLLISLFFLGAAVALLLRAVALPRTAAAARLGQIEAYGFGAVAVDGDGTGRGLGTNLDETADRIGHWAAKHLIGSFREEQVRAQLTMAGLYNLSPFVFLGYRVIATIFCPALFLWFSTVSAVNPLLGFAGTAGAAAAGWVLPMATLRHKVDKRFDLVERDLPELIDLLVLTVEAGLGFNGALQLAAGRLSGPLGDELRLTLQEQRMGLSTNAALSNMMMRADTPSMRSFVRSVVQGETLGVSIGTILRNLAKEMRTRRRQRAEEKAQKAPIKILFPLVFLIFPPMFAVLLYPAVSEFSRTFG